MTRIAFFGHNSADAAIRRRVQAFQDDGLAVTGFMMHRDRLEDVAWDNIDLGATSDGAFLQRIRSIFTGSDVAASQAGPLRKADLIYARNLDMLALAFLAKRKLNLDTPVVYESLDVHRLLSRRDPLGTMVRSLERALLKRCKGLVVSSPGFLTHHFERYYSGSYRPFIVENRLAHGADYGQRPTAKVSRADRPLQLGWVGILRCKRSLDLLAGVADALGERVHIHLHGLPARNEVPVFEPVIDARRNMTYHGRYKAPEDLAALYDGLDVVWAGDFMEAGHNSVWLLPNRIYEGGYYGVPAIAPAGTQTADWIASRHVGFSVPEPLAQTLPDLLATLDQDRSAIAGCSSALLSQPEETFIQPPGFLASLIAQIVSDH